MIGIALVLIVLIVIIAVVIILRVLEFLEMGGYPKWGGRGGGCFIFKWGGIYPSANYVVISDNFLIDIIFI